MARIVMKFGGTSVANLERIRVAAQHIKREYDAGHEIAVIVSAMAGATNQLVQWTREAGALHDTREYDTIVSSGEQVTSGLMAIVLQGMGIHARSWQGWQIPIRTDGSHGSARIEKIEADELCARLKDRQVAVISGFQGVADSRRITTLGRGGSDTSAVAVAAAIDAARCDIYTDVDGVYTTDPRIVPLARRLNRISYEEMLEMASLGAKVLQTRSVEMAMKHHVPLYVRSSFEAPDSLAPAFSEGNDFSGTLVCDEDEIMEQHIVSGIAYSKDEAKVTILSVEDKPGVSANIFGLLADANINVDMIVQNVSDDGRYTDMTFTVPVNDFDRAQKVILDMKDELGFRDLICSTNVVKVSVIGVGMRSHAGVAARMFRALADKGINIQAIATSEIKISVLIDAAYTELAVRALHSVYGLDKK
ncbi:MAG: aspartate kinase [Fimbriimonadaceae bacterium]|nr:aspartate kinase [Alphaproteobacteria bacterium]